MAKRRVTQEERTEKRKALMGKLEAGIAECRESDRFKEWLTVCAKFHKYSYGNVMLIMMQKPGASQVAGFQTWRKMKRYVRKGERGIQILAPQAYRRTEEAEGGEEETHEGIYFRAVHVFDVSQTDGDELPTPLDELAGMDDAGLFAKLDNIRHSEGLSVSREEGKGPGGANGSYTADRREIWIRPDVSLPMATKTYAHELAHHFAEHNSNGHCREERETIAEAVAFVVLGHYGIDAGAYSFGYLAAWTDDKTFKAKLGEIQKIASKLIETIALTPAPIAKGDTHKISRILDHGRAPAAGPKSIRRIVAPKAEAEAPALDPELYAKDGRRKWQGSLWRTCFTPCQEHTPAKLSAVVVLALADRRGRCDACKAATHPVAQAWALANTQRLTGKPAAEVKHYVPKELYGLPGPDLPANPAGGRKVPLPGGYGHGDGSIPLFQRSRELYISARDNAPKIAGQPLGDWAA